MSDNDQFVKTIEQKDNEIKEIKNHLDNETNARIEFQKQILALQLENAILDNKVFDITKDEPLESFWNDKRPKSTLVYGARAIPNGTKKINVDPRIFWQLCDDGIPTVSGSNDEKAMQALNLVKNKISYVADSTQFKSSEVWLFPWETWELRKGDCEDGAILLANIMLKSGVPYWRIRLNAGDVEGGGHCWATYLKEDDNKWYILDWCYWPNESLEWLKYHNAENYFNIWFSFNTKYIYKNETFERE